MNKPKPISPATPGRPARIRFLSRSDTSHITDWTRKLGMDESEPLALDRPALLVLDMQNDFLLARGQLPVWGGPAAIGPTRALIDAFRRTHRLVVFTRHVCLEPTRHLTDLKVMCDVVEPLAFLQEGTPGAEIHRALTPEPYDLVVTKYRYSAFFDTTLNTLLRVNNITEVVITGVATNICCEATAHDAFFRGFGVIFTIDATGGTDESAHLASLRNIQLSYGRLATASQACRSLNR